MSEIDDLNKRISAIEQQVNKAKIYAGAIALALVFGFGVSWIKMPSLAITAAKEAMKGSVIEEANREALVRLDTINETAELAKGAADRANKAATEAGAKEEEVKRRLREISALLPSGGETRCKLEMEGMVGKVGVDCADTAVGSKMGEPVETKLTANGGGWSDWSGWQITAISNGTSCTLIRTRLYCR